MAGRWPRCCARARGIVGGRPCAWVPLCVFGGVLRLPSVIVFLAHLIGTQIAGIVGALLAVPVAAAENGSASLEPEEVSRASRG